MSPYQNTRVNIAHKFVCAGQTYEQATQKRVNFAAWTDRTTSISLSVVNILRQTFETSGSCRPFKTVLEKGRHQGIHRDPIKVNRNCLVLSSTGQNGHNPFVVKWAVENLFSWCKMSKVLFRQYEKKGRTILRAALVSLWHFSPDTRRKAPSQTRRRMRARTSLGKTIAHRFHVACKSI